MKWSCLVLITCCVTAWAADTQPAEPRRVTLVTTPHPTYLSAAKVIEESLAKSGVHLSRLELKEKTPQFARELRKTNPDLIITVGSIATETVLTDGPNVPVVHSMVPNAADLVLPNENDQATKRTTGVTTDVSPTDQLAWIAMLAPEVRTIGLPYSDNTAQTMRALQAEAKVKNLVVVPIPSQKDEFSKTLKTLSEKNCEAVLMLPDAGVYNSPNVQALLLWGLRQKQPVWSFSPNIVKAGAFGAQYSDTDEVARQTAELVMHILAGHDLAKLNLQYANSIHTAINIRTAAMIGLPVGEETLEKVDERFGDKQ